MKTITPFCHCEERSDAAIQPNHPTPLATPTVVIARSASTRQSSDRVRQPPHRPGIPHNVPDWIATPYRARNDKSVWIATPCRVPNDRRWWFEALPVFFAKTMERARCHGHPFDLRTGIDS